MSFIISDNLQTFLHWQEYYRRKVRISLITFQISWLETLIEAGAWHSIVAVLKGFLGKMKACNYQELVVVMLNKLPSCWNKNKYLGPFIHLNRFSENLGDVTSWRTFPLRHQDYSGAVTEPMESPRDVRFLEPYE